MEEALLAWLEKEKERPRKAELKDMVGFLRERFGVGVSQATVCRALGRRGRVQRGKGKGKMGGTLGQGVWFFLSSFCAPLGAFFGCRVQGADVFLGGVVLGCCEGD